VIDGDTIELENGNVIRYLDINTPELNHPTNGLECYAEEATELNRKYVEGKQIKLLSSGENQDKYGRYLRYVFVDNMFINGLLVYEGAAFSYSYGTPNILYQTLIQLEASARENEKGLWKDCNY
jgi:micrococcal nuclease